MRKITEKIPLSGFMIAALCGSAFATSFDIPAGELKSALAAYVKQTGVTILYANDEMKGVKTKGAEGDFSTDDALSRILTGTGFEMRHQGGGIEIVRDHAAVNEGTLTRTAAAPLPSASTATLETVTVTSSKIGGDVQNIPISITALSQEQLTQTQTAGGPDLVKQVPNLTFSKTNFTGYNIEIRGIGTQAISVTTDPAVAVAFNDIPFLRNHFFEQEFYDVSQVQVLRGPQGTLYGRNATAGVVNMVSAKPSDQFEAMASADIGNYENRRLEGMLNIPVVDDRFDVRVAGEWTKRSGYTFNETTDQSVDGRDLWSSRVTIGMKPIEKLQAYLVWEHFSEDDDRLRSGKQLCKKDPGPTSVDGLDLLTLQNASSDSPSDPPGFDSEFARSWLSQGCLPVSLYSKDAYETPNGQAIPFVAVDEFYYLLLKPLDPYASQTQSPSLRVIQSKINPSYRAKNDTLEFNADYALMPALTLTSQTGYNSDFLYSTEDFNRFDTEPGLFSQLSQGFNGPGSPTPVVNGTYCDPQLGCSSSIVGQDLSQEHAWQFSQEMRLASNFSGPFNFSVGANYMHYQTIEDYYIFFNLITATEQLLDNSGPGQYDICGIPEYNFQTNTQYFVPVPIHPIQSAFNFQRYGGTTVPIEVPSIFGCADAIGTYIDPNPIDHLNGLGHNYFRSDNPYRLNSLAGFGEAYYQVTPDVKLTAGLRWTDDSKFFFDIPSQVFLMGGGYPVLQTISQEWKEWTGRFVANWTPKLDFTDATMIYVSYSRGYKGGGANPPGPYVDFFSPGASVTHPLTFAPEFVNAYELGTKNTLLDGGLTLNGDVFYYDYKGYQISELVDRTAVNLNFNAKVKGAELEATWEPLPGLRFNFAGGLEDTSVDKGQSAVDFMDRTAGHTDWVVVKPYISDTSNCILPSNVIREIFEADGGSTYYALDFACDAAYIPNSYLTTHGGPARVAVADMEAVGFDPSTAPNGGTGFSKDLSGNKLPNAPPFTLSAGAQYTVPVTTDWAGTLRGDFYWQGNSFARIFNDEPYDQLHGYTNVNLSLIFTNQDGWQVMGYVKNVFNTTAITGAFLNTDDTALTTNVFTTDPRLFGVRLTKNW